MRVLAAKTTRIKENIKMFVRKIQEVKREFQKKIITLAEFLLL